MAETDLAPLLEQINNLAQALQGSAARQAEQLTGLTQALQGSTAQQADLTKDLHDKIRYEEKEGAFRHLCYEDYTVILLYLINKLFGVSLSLFKHLVMR